MDEIRSSLAEDFSLARGGPFYRLLVRLGHRGGERERVVLRALLAAFITWLPMLIFSLIQGVAFGSQVKAPFLCDIAVNVRFLVALPILILAESTIDGRWRILVLQFLRSRLINQAELPAFEAVIKRVTLLRDRVLPEAIMILVAYLPDIFGARIELLSGISNWNSRSAGDVSLAGWWFNFVAAPAFRFLLLSWVWRMLLWTLFLWRVSRLKLHLVATHADRAAGLGFLSEGQKAFSSIVFAGGSAIAAKIGNALLYQGATLASMKWRMVAYVVMASILLIVPLLAVAPVLYRTKRKAMFDVGALLTTHNQLFDEKWLRGNSSPEDVILGSPDASSLADLGRSFEVVRNMTVVPIDKNTLIRLVAAAALPMMPVVFFATPADELIRAVLKMLA